MCLVGRVYSYSYSKEDSTKLKKNREYKKGKECEKIQAFVKLDKLE